MRAARNGAIALLALGLGYFALFPGGQRADRSFNAAVQTPAHTNSHPILTFDEGHNNAHVASGTYAPFANLVRADGYDLRPSKHAFTPNELRGTSVLVIVNADGGTNPKLFGFNLVPLRKGVRGSAAFTDDEVRVLREWVDAGGSLLLIADHTPFGTAAAGLAKSFGVAMRGGFTEVANQYEGQLDPSVIEFSAKNGLLANHPIISGRSPEETVRRLWSFTGQSLDTQTGSVVLALPPSAVEIRPIRREEIGRVDPSTHAGTAQAVALEYGRGRIVVLGEAAMITAQIDERGRRFGMNQPGLDNRQFALNLVHWLSRLL